MGSEMLRPHLGVSPKILTLGCGNSDLSEKMYADGFKDIINTDVAGNLMDELREWYAERAPSMQFMQMDATLLAFEGSSFDVVLEKGVYDVLSYKDTLKASAEAYRVLRPGAVLISISRFDAKAVAESSSWATCNMQKFFSEHVNKDCIHCGEPLYMHTCVRP